MKKYSQVIIPELAFEIQNAQYRDCILLQGTAPAGSTGVDYPIGVSNEGHFQCQFITGSFETIASPAGAIVDTGVNYLFGQLRDGSRNLFSDRVPLDLVLSPGRRKSANSTTVLTDPAGNALFEPLPFSYLFKVNTNITMNISNTSDEAVAFEILFHGLRIVSSAAADTCRMKARNEK